MTALTVDVETIELRKTAHLGDDATVHLDAVIRIATDRPAVRQLVQQVALERGGALPEALAAGVADAFANAMRSRHELDVSLPLQVEGPVWRFCWW